MRRTRSPQLIRAARRRQRGVVLLEAAACVQLLAILAFCIVDVGFAYRDKLTVNSAVRGTARVDRECGPVGRRRLPRHPHVARRARNDSASASRPRRRLQGRCQRQPDEPELSASRGRSAARLCERLQRVFGELRSSPRPRAASRIVSSGLQAKFCPTTRVRPMSGALADRGRRLAVDQIHVADQALPVRTTDDYRQGRDATRTGSGVIMRRRDRNVRPEQHRVLFFGRRERGYVAILTLFLAIPLFAMAAFAADVGYWYSKAARLAADRRRGIAGGRRLAARQAEGRHRGQEDPACRTASTRRTLMSDGTPRWTVQIDAPTSERLRVTVTDNSAGRLFSQLLDNSKVVIIRSSLSEYIKPIPLGSPISKYGNDPTVSWSAAELLGVDRCAVLHEARRRSLRREVRRRTRRRIPAPRPTPTIDRTATSTPSRCRRVMPVER